MNLHLRARPHGPDPSSIYTMLVLNLYLKKITCTKSTYSSFLLFKKLINI